MEKDHSTYEGFKSAHARGFPLIRSLSPHLNGQEVHEDHHGDILWLTRVWQPEVVEPLIGYLRMRIQPGCFL